MTLTKGDFITLDFTGKQTETNEVFDTTKEDVAKQHSIYEQQVPYEPITICIGEGHVLPGLENALEGQEPNSEIEVTLKPEEAFGKKSAKAIKLMPKKVFEKQQIHPRPGLEVNIDDQRGTIKSISGNRVIVDFNHPLSGRELTYELEIGDQITDTKQQAESLVNMALRHKAQVDVKEQKATITFPVELPEQITEEITKTLKRLTKIESVEYQTPKKD